MNRKLVVVLLASLWLAQPVHAQEFAAEANPAVAGRINAQLAIEYLKQGQLAVAKEKIDKAVRENPRDLGVQMSAGLVYERLQETDKAEDHFREALRIDSTNPDAQNALGAFFCRNGKMQKGEEMFLRAARNPLYTTPEVALTNAGVCARQDGKLDKAEQFLRQAIAQPRRYPEALLQLSGVAFDGGKFLEARAFLQRYLAETPGTAAVLMLGYRIEKALGDSAAMAGYAGQLHSRFPDSAETKALDDPDSDLNKTGTAGGKAK